MAFILALILILYILRKTDYESFESPFTMASFMALLIEIIVYTLFGCCVEKEEQSFEVLSKTEIVALQDTNGVSGKFFLGCGKIDGELHYAYYYETEYGIKYGSISGENSKMPVYIKYLENSSEAPYILQYGKTETTIYNKPSLPLWISIIAQLYYGDLEDGEIIDQSVDAAPAFISDPEHYRYEIWIPEGTILQEYELDLN